jgi:hypothetical protein
MPKSENGCVQDLEEIQLELDATREFKRVASLLVQGLSHSLLAAQGIRDGLEKQEMAIELKLTAAKGLTLSKGGLS